MRTLPLASIVAFVGVTSGHGVAPMATSDQATAFLDALTAAQRAKAVLPLEHEARTRFAYTPGPRPGIALKELSAEQGKAALNLLKSSLSEAGFRKAEAIRTELESHLREIEKNPGRDPEAYSFMFFGQPAPKGHWSWRYEGHHVSLSFAYVDGKVVSSTPQFLGTNPAEVREGPKKGLRVLKDEEEVARELLGLLSPDQIRQAVVAVSAPPDILTSNHSSAQSPEPSGISFARLDRKQQAVLKRLVAVHAGVQEPEQARRRLDKIERAGWSAVRFAWMGGSKKVEGHYYRVQGPTFLIEYDNTQNGANHIHSVWRDFRGDFGRDVLGEHYQKSPQGHGHSRLKS